MTTRGWTSERVKGGIYSARVNLYRKRNDGELELVGSLELHECTMAPGQAFEVGLSAIRVVDAGEVGT